MMPPLFIIILILVVCSVTLPGAGAGIEFLLKPTEEEIQAYQAEQAAAAQSDAPTESEASSAEQAP